MYTATPLPAFSDNYIWMLTKDDHPGMVIIDPGDATVVLNAMERYQRPLTAILITHHHPDHTGGVNELHKQFSTPVYGPANSPFTGITHPLTTGDEIKILGNQLHVQQAPGHTLDHLLYFSATPTPQLFCGDTLFLAGCGRLFEGTPAQMLAAMRYCRSLPHETLIYCTHEYSLANLNFAQAVEPDNPAIQEQIQRCTQLRDDNLPTLPSTLAVELTINPFLRTDQSSVRTSAERHLGVYLEDELSTFTAVREWKNNF